MRPSSIAFQFRLRRHYLMQRLRLRFAPPRYYLATYGDMGLQVEFFRNRSAFDEAVEQAEDDHNYDRIDTFEDGCIGDIYL